MINYEAFTQLDIKIGKIIAAEKITGTDKLLKLEIDLGTEKRTLVAGIAEMYQPQDLVGKEIPILVNLEPKRLKGIESNGMILAADNNGKPVLLHPDTIVPAGSKVK